MLYMIGSSRLHRKMLETSRAEFDELPASIPWIVFDKARAVVKLFHTRSVASQFHGGKALNSLGWLKDYIVGDWKQRQLALIIAAHPR